MLYLSFLLYFFFSVVIHANDDTKHSFRVYGDIQIKFMSYNFKSIYDLFMPIKKIAVYTDLSKCYNNTCIITHCKFSTLFCKCYLDEIYIANKSKYLLFKAGWLTPPKKKWLNITNYKSVLNNYAAERGGGKIYPGFMINYTINNLNIFYYFMNSVTETMLEKNIFELTKTHLFRTFLKIDHMNKLYHIGFNFKNVNQYFQENINTQNSSYFSDYYNSTFKIQSDILSFMTGITLEFIMLHKRFCIQSELAFMRTKIGASHIKVKTVFYNLFNFFSSYVVTGENNFYNFNKGMIDNNIWKTPLKIEIFLNYINFCIYKNLISTKKSCHVKNIIKLGVNTYFKNNQVEISYVYTDYYDCRCNNHVKITYGWSIEYKLLF